MHRSDKLVFLGILTLAVFAILSLVWSPLGRALGRESFVLGLDLRGGAHLVYQADLSKAENPKEAMKGVIDVIERRINAYGVTEPVIRQMGKDRILVQLPGIKKISEAKKLIGQTALIKFKEPEMGAYLIYQVSASQEKGGLTKLISKIKEYIANKHGVQPLIDQIGENRIRVQLPGKKLEQVEKLTDELTKQASLPLKLETKGEEPVLDEKGNPKWIPAKAQYNGQEVELTSRLFKGNTAVVLNQLTNEPEVAFEWNKEGATIFEQITKRLYERPQVTPEHWEGRLGIFLGDDYISAPVVQAVIKERGVITGLDLKEAQWLSRLLNAGRIPVPLHTIEEHDVSPTLGANFIDWSLRAGAIGLIMVILFMILYYRFPGLMAGFALLVYAALVLAAFKLIPVTLTLAGIAGFVLSIGMAVDANVLIFERMKEELRGGRTLRASIEVGFDRAWPAIRDANITTFISCGILYWMGSKLAVPAVMGFSLTLFIGVAISMFSALVVTRNFLRLLSGTWVVRKPTLFTSEK